MTCTIIKHLGLWIYVEMDQALDLPRKRPLSVVPVQLKRESKSSII
jgi:hypothetical protein